VTEAAKTQAFTIGEVTGWSLLQFATWSGRTRDFENEVVARSGMEAPKAVGDISRELLRTLIRIAPTRFWLLDDSGMDLTTVGGDPAVVSLTPLSQGRQRFRLGGSRCCEVLAKCVAIDWVAPGSVPDRAVQTMLHRVPVLFLRVGAAEFDVYAPRSFARSVHEWIVDAALEFADE
jgi:methylglutamate dehydrogenase subunit D